MGYRGIIPDRLEDLSTKLRQDAEKPATVSRSAATILSRHGYGTAAESLSALTIRVSTWGNETAANLAWRAQLIKTGQNSPASPGALLGATFATEAGFSFQNVESWQESRERIEQAVADITHWLEQRWNDWDVTNNDLHNIEKTLERLNGDEVNAVIAALTPTQLERWIEEMGNSINGISRAEKQEILTLLAGNADGEQLGRIHDALLITGTQEDMIDLGMAIQVYSPDRVIAGFVMHVMAADLPGHRYSTVAPALALSGIDSRDVAAAAVQLVVAVAGTVELIVVDSLVTARIEDTGAACYEVDPLASLIAAIGRGKDSAMIAKAFAAIAQGATDPALLHQLLDERYDLNNPRSPSFQVLEMSPSADAAAALLAANEVTLRDAATTLLTADADGVITELATSIDPDGTLTTDYLYRLVDAERAEDLGRIARALRGGDVVDPLRFADPGPDPDYPYPHAQNLAYLAGTLTNALEREADKAKGQIRSIAGIASLASAAAGGVFEFGIRTTIGAAAGELGFDLWKIDGVQDDIDRYLEDVSVDVARATQPDEDNTIAVLGAGLAWQLWMKRFRSIVKPG